MRQRWVQVGPFTIEPSPARDFDRFNMIELEAGWSIVAASAEKNLHKVPLWKVIAAAYLEGVHHGWELTEEKVKAVAEQKEGTG